MLLCRAGRSPQPLDRPPGRQGRTCHPGFPARRSGGTGNAAFGWASVGASLGECGGSDPPRGAEGWEKGSPSDPSLPLFPSDVRLSRCFRPGNLVLSEVNGTLGQ